MRPSPAAGPVVLVVDDEPIIRLNMADLLAQTGFTPIEAADADEALVMIGTHQNVAVLFTDVNMPGSMDGIELAHLVHAVRPEIQLIITSGRERPGNRDIPDGSRFIAKPYSDQSIIDLVMSACATAVARRPSSISSSRS